MRNGYGTWGAASLAVLLTAGCLAGLPACAGPERETSPSPAPSPNTLTVEEAAAGWILLFNGRDFSGWRGLGREEVPAGHWEVEDGAIKKVSSGQVPLQADGQPLEGGDLMTAEAFTDFELSWEWKISRAGNSGVKYNVSEELSRAIPPPYAALGFEYQLLDDEGHPDAGVSATHTAGALYDLVAPRIKALNPVGEYNTSRIVWVGSRGEHWLNGMKVLEFDLDSPDMRERLSKSKYRDIAGFADRRAGHIVLQDHTDEAWFRSIKLLKRRP